jgi:hypothetical protein
MKMASLIVMAGLAVVLTGIYGEARCCNQVKVYYFPLLAHASTPITSKWIEKCYDLTSVIPSRLPKINEILRREGSPSGGVDPNLIRLKLVPPTGPVILYDLLGNVDIGGKAHQLDLSDRRALRKTILGALPDQ